MKTKLLVFRDKNNKKKKKKKNTGRLCRWASAFRWSVEAELETPCLGLAKLNFPKQSCCVEADSTQMEDLCEKRKPPYSLDNWVQRFCGFYVRKALLRWVFPEQELLQCRTNIFSFFFFFFSLQSIDWRMLGHVFNPGWWRRCCSREPSSGPWVYKTLCESFLKWVSCRTATSKTAPYSLSPRGKSLLS